MHKPLILIDKVMKSDIGMAHSDKTAVAGRDNGEHGITATAVQDKIMKSGVIGIAQSQKNADVDVGSGGTDSITATANKDDKGSIAVTASQDVAETGDYSVSEVTLCPETDTDGCKGSNERHVETQRRVSAPDEKFKHSVDETVQADLTQGSKDILSETEEKQSGSKTEEMVENSNDTHIHKRSSVTIDFEGSEIDNTRGTVSSEKSSDKGAVEKIVANVDNVLRKPGNTDRETEGSETEEDVLGRKIFTMGSQDNLDELVESLHNSDSDKVLELQDEDFTSSSDGQELTVQVLLLAMV